MAEENQTRRRDDMHPDVPLQWEGEPAQAEQPLWDDNGEPWNEAAEKAERARLASQSQAAQPTSTAPLKLYAFTEDGMEIDNAFGHWYKKDDVERLFAAHIAGTSQATKAQAEPEDDIEYHIDLLDGTVTVTGTRQPDEWEESPSLREALQAMEMALIGYTHQNDVTRAALAKCRAALQAPVASVAKAETGVQATAEAIEHAARICESYCACDNGEDDEEINRLLRNRAAQIRGLIAPTTSTVSAPEGDVA